MKNKWIRMLVCFVMVCSILVNISPIRAEASVAAAYIGVEAANVIASALLGLGVGFASYELAQPYLEDCKNFLTLNYDFISDEDKIQVWSANPDATYSDAPYYVAQELVEAVREWMFESETVMEGSVPSGSACYGDTILVSFIEYPSLPVRVIMSDSSGVYLFEANDMTLELSGSDAERLISFGYSCKNTYTGNGWEGSGRSIHNLLSLNNYKILWSNYDIYDFDGSLFFAGSEPVYSLLTVGESLESYYIAPQAEEYAIAYPTWVGGTTAVPIPGTTTGEEEETIPAVPIGLGQTIGETIGLTQEDVWAGTSTYADTKTEAGTNTGTGTTTGSLADIKTAIDALPGAIADSLTDKIVPSAPAASYAMELTDFFPFCLPYDMYEFLTILKATPQAPVFTWPISVPAIGLYYEIQVDLSPWNDVAALFRKMELLAFCVGLAYVSREKFLRA